MDGLITQIRVPAIFEMLLPTAGRLHNAIAKDAVRDTLVKHHRRRIPGHFQRPAHGKYGYAQRSPRYRAAKQKKYGSSIDLVRTGRTKQQMTTQRQITVSGQATAGTIRGRLTLRFPFPGGSLRFKAAAGTRQRVTIEQMAREIRTITSDEIQQINRDIRGLYVDGVKKRAGQRQLVTIH